MHSLSIKRIYEPADPGEDGQRVLVDRLWPRGVSKERAALDAWLPEVGPSTELRRWFGHEPDRWPEFVSRYRAELEGNPHLAELRDIVDLNPTTLVYGARDTQRNQAVVLAMVLRGESHAPS